MTTQVQKQLPPDFFQTLYKQRLTPEAEQSRRKARAEEDAVKMFPQQPKINAAQVLPAGTKVRAMELGKDGAKILCVVGVCVFVLGVAMASNSKNDISMVTGSLLSVAGLVTSVVSGLVLVISPYVWNTPPQNKYESLPKQTLPKSADQIIFESVYKPAPVLQQVTIVHTDQNWLS